MPPRSSLGQQQQLSSSNPTQHKPTLPRLLIWGQLPEGAIGHAQHKAPTDSRGFLGMLPTVPPHTKPLTQTLLQSCPWKWGNTGKASKPLPAQGKSTPRLPLGAGAPSGNGLGAGRARSSPWNGMAEGSGLLPEGRKGGTGNTKAKTHPEPPPGSPLPF